MRQLCTLLLISITATSVIAQSVNTDYCDLKACKLPRDHEAHSDPYYNWHLCENFDAKQSDFSKEYLQLRTKKSGQNILHDLRSFDFSSIWLTVNGHQNGVIGLDYKRIRIHISHASRDLKDDLVYHITGKSNVAGNICDFAGEIRLIRAYQLKSDRPDEFSGNLFAEYTFREDKSQNHVGTFQGVFECFFNLDRKNRKAILDESSGEADGYFNRTYVGTWKGYNSDRSKKCIWGDYRLPFTFDFDCGDGEMVICEKYVQNGWTTFNSTQEYEVAGDKAILKDQWWKLK